MYMDREYNYSNEQQIKIVKNMKETGSSTGTSHMTTCDLKTSTFSMKLYCISYFCKWLCPITN